MLAATRRDNIKKIVLEKKAVKVSELCEMFQVSDETIRRDLEELEKEGLVEKNYGGAVLRENIIIPPLMTRSKEYIEEKEKIASKAVEEIYEGSTIFLDAGTTTHHVARAIKSFKNITVITNGLNIATELANNSNINLFIAGGKLKSGNFSLVGPETINSIERYNIDILFLASGGISLKKGLTTSDTFEAEVKRTMIKSAKRVIVVADSSKFGKDAMVSFCSINEIEKIITSGNQNHDLIQELNKKVDIIAV